MVAAAIIGAVMEQARWQRIEALFDQAMELPDGERRGFVERECGGDEELRREVVELLASAPTAAGALPSRRARGPATAW